MTCEKVSVAVSFGSKGNSYCPDTDVCIKTFSSQYRDAGCAQENNLVLQTKHLLALICGTTEPEIEPLWLQMQAGASCITTPCFPGLIRLQHRAQQLKHADTRAITLA